MISSDMDLLAEWRDAGRAGLHVLYGRLLPPLGGTYPASLVDGPGPAFTTSVLGLVEARGNLTTFVPAISPKRSTPTSYTVPT